MRIPDKDTVLWTRIVSLYEGRDYYICEISDTMVSIVGSPLSDEDDGVIKYIPLNHLSQEFVIVESKKEYVEVMKMINRDITINNITNDAWDNQKGV